MLLGSLGGAIGIMAVPALVTLADLGPWPTAATRKETLEHTLWADGVRVVNDTNWVPLKAADIEIGQLVNAEPENLRDLHGTEYQNMKAKTALIVVRMDPNSIKIPESRQDWQVGGILAYSKICTHVGCPISCGSSRLTTCCAPATRARSTSATPASSSSAPPHARCPSCRSRSTQRATSWPKATSRSRSAPASSSGTPATTSRRVTDNGEAR
jgi:Rieske Fe-S protein